MVKKIVDIETENDSVVNLRKRKRIIPTRTAGTPANANFSNPADDLFAEAFAKRETKTSLIEAPDFPDEPVEETFDPNQPNPNQPNLTQPQDTPPKPTPPHPTVKVKNRQSEKYPVSPERDFSKVANSITRDAIPEGFFKGTSKHTYDALYQRTRAAVVPVRTIKVKKSELMKWSGVSDNTLLKHLTHLKTVGLIKIDYEVGDNNGSVYEVFIPEEIESPHPTPANPTALNQPNPTQTKKLGLPQPQNIEWGGVGKLIQNKDVYDFPKTSSNTIEKTVDDEFPLADFVEHFQNISRKYTGKELSASEREKWGILGELLALEFEIAASRAKSVSSVPAFLTEHLKRRLYSKLRNVRKEKDRPAHLDVGKGSEDKTIGETTLQQQLTDEQRENTLNALREAKATDSIFFREFRTYGEIEYAPEDFKWLLEKLGND